ncbi:MAG TPA: Wzz/FepE/Etk N-terminal domain-containing protein [Vicinamibacterales bacterium]|nr:Wzz/FepE/Etk N-terminal domain-containing protein [Vicinamibacterales bacterium]
MNDPSPLEPAENTFELGDIFAAVRRYWLVIFVIGVVFTGTATVIAFSMAPVYRAESVVTQADDNAVGGLSQMLGGLGGVAAMAGLDLGGKNDIEVSLALLKSKHFLSMFIEENNLLQEFFWRKWDAQAKRWKGDAADAPTLADGVRMLDMNLLSLTRDRRTGLITVAIEWTDRFKAAQWTNALIKRANEVLRESAINDARQSIDFLHNELEKTNVVELQQAIYHLTETQINRIVMANVRQEFAFKVIDPAMAPDAKYKVRPRRISYMLFGAILGGAVGLSTAVLLLLRARRRAVAA